MTLVILTVSLTNSTQGGDSVSSINAWSTALWKCQLILAPYALKCSCYFFFVLAFYPLNPLAFFPVQHDLNATIIWHPMRMMKPMMKSLPQKYDGFLLGQIVSARLGPFCCLHIFDHVESLFFFYYMCVTEQSKSYCLFLVIATFFLTFYFKL